ncbi:uncharacterized protein N7482_008993 [Penicillium canariense]|uniref:Uncharacterized protein n=1 Tax=Penicillium canariense TaxID=189055 RepID=A0A9W9HW81_9EURO|nr:uncharacterized protein N7482_008993 [Penicillium canariense]KAJ5157893.1 hypothetical protein N7482_008993 [Penicillium canariense]
MIIRTAILATLGLAMGVQAHPRGVTNTPIDACSALPRWNNETNIAGPWSFQIVGCHNGTDSEGVCGIEGYGATCNAKRLPDKNGIETGIITIADSPHRGQTMFRCNGALHTFEAFVPSGAGALDWHAICIRQDPSTGEMEWGLGAKNSESIQAYRQYEHGNPTSGFLVGSSRGAITWAVRHSGSGLSGVDHHPFWFVHLVGPARTRWTDEFETQIRIDSR